MTYNLKISDERGEQLRMIASAKGTTIAAQIDGFISTQIEQGVIPADLPNTHIEKIGGRVVIEMAELDAEIPAADVPVFNEVLRSAGNNLTKEDIARKRKLLSGLGALSGIKIEHTGAGVKLISPITGKKHSISFSISKDLADQIERAAE